MKTEKNLVKGKKKHKKGWIILGGILVVLVLVIVSIPKLLFTDYEGLPTTGPYNVKQTAAILVDNNRIETFETDGSNREVPVYFYYPEISETDKNSFPLIIFSHGAFGYYQSNTSTYMELASNGYVVISLDHPYHSFFTKDTEGKTIIVKPEFIKEVTGVNEENVLEEEIVELSHKWLDIRVADMNFVLDCIKETKEQNLLQGDMWFVSEANNESEILDILAMTDTQEIGLMGHSLGGAASVTLGRTRNDIDAVIDLDGTMLGEELGYEEGEYEFYEESYPVPLFFISNEEHHLEREAVGSLYANNVVLENAVDSKYTYFVGSGHMNFTDLPLFSPKLAALLGVGEVDATECITQMNELILEYFNCYLKDSGAVTIKESY